MWLTIAWQYRNEIGIGILCLLVLGIGLHIKRTYALVDKQKVEIQALTTEVSNAKKAIQLQIDTQKALGRIDQRTFTHISSILNTPVPTVLVPAGVLPAVRPANSHK